MGINEDKGLMTSIFSQADLKAGKRHGQGRDWIFYYRGAKIDEYPISTLSVALASF